MARRPAVTAPRSRYVPNWSATEATGAVVRGGACAAGVDAAIGGDDRSGSGATITT